MVVERLSKLIERAESRGELHGVAVSRGAPKVSHLLFADDSFFFFKATSQEAHNFKLILDLHGNASG